MLAQFKCRMGSNARTWTFKMMPVKIIGARCEDHPAWAGFGWFWAQSSFWTKTRLYFIPRPQHAAVIKVPNKCDLIFNAVNGLLCWRRVLRGGDRRLVSYPERLPRAAKPDSQPRLYFFRLCPPSPSVKTLLLIICWAVMKWQMIYWEPKTVFQRRAVLSLCVAALLASCDCRGHK